MIRTIKGIMVMLFLAAVDLDFIALYKDCENVYTYPYQSNCTVVCDETIELGVLEAKHNVMHF